MAAEASDIEDRVIGNMRNEDLSGRERMTWNVLVSWASHFIVVVGGFIAPRFIDRHISQEALGVWDFGWSVVSYFGLLGGGVVSSIGPYVAKHRAAGETEEVNATVSTGLAIYVCAGAIAFGLTLLITLLIPSMFAARFGEHTRLAQWVVFLLGLNVTVMFMLTIFNGVVTGCHRWDMHNGIVAVASAITTIAMIVSIVLGGGLIALAVSTVCGECLAGILHCICAYRVCPGLKVSRSKVRLSKARELVGFGIKAAMGYISVLLLYQTHSLVIVGMLGPAVLAVYSRPMALVKHAKAFVSKFANILSPMSGALEGVKDRSQLRALQIKGSKYGMYIALPIDLTLAVMGGAILHLWMGPRYEHGALIAILALGHLAAHSQQTTYQVLLGLGRHGFPALATAIAAIIALPCSIVCIGPLKLGLDAVAFSLVIPLTIAWGLVIPWLACRNLEIHFGRFCAETMVGPAIACIPFMVCIGGARWWYADRPLASLIAGLVPGGLVLAITYWCWVFPVSQRERFLAKFRHAPTAEPVPRVLVR